MKLRKSVLDAFYTISKVKTMQKETRVDNDIGTLNQTT